jgi:hypothetical protein
MFADNFKNLQYPKATTRQDLNIAFQQQIPAFAGFIALPTHIPIKKCPIRSAKGAL